MKILLVNDNPVVTKLVTLSAQKTDDDVEVIHSIDEISGEKYDLIAVDDALYSDDFFDKIKDKITYKKSLYICSRDSEPSEKFTSVLKKPFLPTDLVELFTTIDKNLESEPEMEKQQEDLQELEELDELDSSEDLQDLQELDDLDLEEINELDEDSDDDFLLNELDEGNEGLGESVLDDEEAQKVKDLLDEEYDLALDLEDEADVDIAEGDTLEDAARETDENIDFEMALDLEDEADVDISEDEEIEEQLSQEDLDELSDEGHEEDLLDEELEDIDFDEKIVLDEEALELDEIESQIEDAVAELDEEELESEVDEETLLDIASNELDSLDELSSKDLKLALGEEVDQEEPVEEKEDEHLVQDLHSGVESENSGVESLKKLLEVLSDQNVAASLKGAKITINISLGDNA